MRQREELNPIIDKGNQVICLASVPYEAGPSRERERMEALEGCEVAYVNPPCTLLAPFTHEGHYERMTHYKPDEGGHITVWHLPPVLAGGMNFRPFNRFNMEMLMLPRVHKICMDMKFYSPVLWVCAPAYGDMVKYVDKDALIYDRGERETKGLPKRVEEELASRCDLVIPPETGTEAVLAMLREREILTRDVR